jgi:hypothetical protein
MPTLSDVPDLTKSFPRSPGDTLGGYVILARAIDKCRATLAGTNGEYNYNCPLDRQFFDFTGVDADEMKNLIAGGATDEEVARWVHEQDRAHSAEEVKAWSEAQRRRGPETPEQKEYFENLREQVIPGRTDVTTWFGLLDAEEGRL